MFAIVSKSIVELFLCMAVGFGCQKKGLLSRETVKGLSAMLINVNMSATMVVAMQNISDPGQFKTCVEFLPVEAAIFLVGALVGFITCRLLRIDKKRMGIYMFGLTFPNVGYMGIPVLTQVFGTEGTMYAAVVNLVFNLFAFSFGIKMVCMGYDRDIRINFISIIKTPVIFVTFIAVALFYFSVRIPDMIEKPIELLAGMTTPLSMIILGAIMAGIENIKFLLTNYKMYIMLFMRLLLLPLIFFLALRPFVHNQLHLSVFVLLPAMPAGTLLSIMANRYDLDDGLASLFVFSTTLLCLLTIPAVSLLL